MEPEKAIIGANELVQVGGKEVPAKIDTGADASSIWASNFRITDDHKLQFVLFDEGSPYYTGEVLTREEYDAVAVRSSNGETTVRYRTEVTLVIADRKIKVRFNLSDRSRNQYPILIGRRTIKDRFYVDSGREAAPLPKILSQYKIKKEINLDPHEFHRKYIDKNLDGVISKDESRQEKPQAEPAKTKLTTEPKTKTKPRSTAESATKTKRKSQTQN